MGAKMQNLVSTLTDREREVLDLLGTGATNKEIAVELCLALQTIKFHLANIFRKLGVSNRSGAVAYWLQGREIETPAITDGQSFTEKDIRAAAALLVEKGLVDRKTVNGLVLDLLAALGGKI